MKELKQRNKYLHKKAVECEGNDWLCDDIAETINKKWYDEVPEDPKDFPECKESEIIILKSEAEIVLKKEEEIYGKKSNGKGPDRAWLRTVMSKGTASDKVAALVVTIQESPVYNLPALRNLVNTVKVSKKKECLTVMETLTELFLSDLLRPDYKLRSFDRRPLSVLGEMSSGNVMSRKRLLCHWLFEDQLKVLYAQFTSALDAVGRDTVDSHRERAVTAVYKLLAGNPEQEDVLLKILVNKLGDPNQKVVSKVIYSLTQLLRVHPVMKQVVASEVENFLFRPNVGSRAQYYAICFLSQYLFDSEDTELAENIISMYFSFFKANIKKGDIDSRMMGALLMGVNRAYPFAKLQQSELSEHIDTMYKLVHVCNFNISLQTLTLLYQIVGHSNDRFYSALYKKLLDPQLASSAHQAMFINLVYKALKNDTNIDRVRVFIKRLLQVCLNSPSQLCCALLYLVSELVFKRPQLLALKTHRHLQYQEDDNNDDGDDEEHYTDVPLETTGEVELTEEKPKPAPTPGWFHCKTTSTRVESHTFDGNQRNPAHARGEYAAYEELTALSAHFHPTVALFAKNILDKQPVKYTGDPLQDFTLLRFLERFVFKNPKQMSGATVGSGPDPCLAQRRHYQTAGAKAVGVTSASYLQQDERSVPVDELFLFRYLQDRKPCAAKEKGAEDDSDVDSVASEEFEDLLDNMGVGKVDQDDLDFADEIGDKLRTKNKSKRQLIEPDSESGSEVADEDEEEDLTDLDEDEEEELTDLEGDGEDGSDAEAIDFGEDVEDFDGEIDMDNLDSEEDDFPGASSGFKTKKKGNKGQGIHSMFAPAEKFAEMLEEAGASRLKVGTAQDVSNKDNAALKQLEWESKRNQQQWTNHSNKRKHFTKPSFNKTKRKKFRK